jgi:hypothetical protein
VPDYSARAVIKGAVAGMAPHALISLCMWLGFDEENRESAIVVLLAGVEIFVLPTAVVVGLLLLCSPRQKSWGLGILAATLPGVLLVLSVASRIDSATA